MTAIGRTPARRVILTNGIVAGKIASAVTFGAFVDILTLVRRGIVVIAGLVADTPVKVTSNIVTTYCNASESSCAF